MQSIHYSKILSNFYETRLAQAYKLSYVTKTGITIQDFHSSSKLYTVLLCEGESHCILARSAEPWQNTCQSFLPNKEDFPTRSFNLDLKCPSIKVANEYFLRDKEE